MRKRFRSAGRRFTVLPLAAAAFLTIVLSAAPALAQITETGSISGRVVDVDGVPMPGVTIALDSVEVPSRTTVSRANGTYRFLALPAGEYTLTFSLTGFTTMINEGITVGVDANTTLNITMTLAAVEETVRVVADTPVVDVKKTGLSRNMTEQYMQSIPSARDPWVMMEHTAGIQVNKQNIGGSESGMQSRFNAAGSDNNDTIWTYDGAETTSLGFGGAGRTSMYYDFDAFEEISITTGGNDPSIATGGARINFVTKRGGNRWRASGRFYFTDGALQADPLYDHDADDWKPGVDPDDYYPGYIGNAINNIKDYGLEIGGPVVRDRLYVWGSYGMQDIRLLIAATEDNTQLENYHLKATGHIGAEDVLNFTFLHANKTREGVLAGPDVHPDATWDQDGPTPIYTVKWQRTFSDNMYLEAVFNYMDAGYFVNPRGCTKRGIAPGDCGVQGPQAKYDDDTGFWWSGRSYADASFPSTNVRVDVNNYLAETVGDHEFKYGYSYRGVEVSSSSGVSGGAWAVFDAAEPVEAWIVGPALYNYGGKRHSFYFGDTWALERWTLNAGLRFDHQTSFELPSASGPSPIDPDLIPARSFAGNDPGWGWSSLSPRLGLVYDLTGDARTILRLNAARYASQMSLLELSYMNTTGWSEVDYEWFDLNGNTFVDIGETGDIVWISSGFDPDNPNEPSQNQINETVPPKTDEIIAGIDYEVVRNLAVGASYIWKKVHTRTWAPPTGITSDNYYSVRYNLDGKRDPDGTLDVYHLDQRLPYWVTYGQRPDYHTTYNGLELTLTKRFSDNWMANASFNWADYRQHFPTAASYIDPTNIWAEDSVVRGTRTRGGTYYGAARWYWKSSAMYQLPRGFTLAGFFQIREGHLRPVFTKTANRRNGIGRIDAWIQPVDAERLPVYWVVDLRLEKVFDFPRDVRLHVIGDMFNTTNNTITLATHNQYNSSNFDKIVEVVQGFTFRLGLRLVLR
jgi:hypothetical protein